MPPRTWAFDAPSFAGFFAWSPHGPLVIHRMIEFRTSTWRAITADDFTFAAVRRVAQAISTRIAGMVANRKVSLGWEGLDQAYSVVGAIMSERIGIPLTPELQNVLAGRLAGGGDESRRQRLASGIELMERSSFWKTALGV